MLEDKINSLISDFSNGNLIAYLEEKNKNFTFYKEDKNPLSYQSETFSEIYKIADIKLEDETNFAVFTIGTTKELTERSSKKNQFELGKKILKNEGFDAGFFVFYDENKNFRFSLIHSIYKGTRREFSHYKRYTYYVEKGKPYHTFKKALYEIEIKNIKSILNAFAVQPLVKQFYTEIQNWYAWALKNVWFPGGNNEENLIRLITRIVFVWFLKEKKLIPEKIFDEDFLKNIVKDFKKGNYYYNTILQNLFFATLNRYPKERSFAEDKGFPTNKKDFGVKTLFRYENFLNITKGEFIKLFENVPFINGGLFECLDEDHNYIDGFSRNENKRAKIPDNLFFSSEIEEDLSNYYGQTKKVKVRGLINILKDYNFTVDESSPIDIEVSLDPELLGHIFENLLASYNPETQTTARKATGSYYTPKEIVDFMVEESLIEYLKTKTSIDEEKLISLFSYAEEIVETNEKEKKALLNAIDTIKIIDPAVGSGAFPMGIVHKLVYLLNRIDPDNKLWHELQFNKALKEVEEVLKIKDKKKREELLKEINDSFDEVLTYPDYARKLYIIQNSIYGVDIQNIAIQICKLRFFLSLLIDQKINPDKENYGIKPLPHLETNFVSANSLVGLESSKSQSLSNEEISEEISKLKDELKRLYKKHFSIKTRQEKKKIQEEARKIREKIKELLIKNEWPNEDVEKVSNFDIFDQRATADWFDPEWMFGVESGFDIVIANPPYIKEYVNRKAFNGIRENPYYQGKMDIWYFFACKGIDFLKEKGILTFIAQNNWITNYGAKKMRDKIMKDARILKLIDFGSYFVFESSDIQTMIMMFIKDNKSDNYHFEFRRILKNNPNFEDMLKILNKETDDGIEYLTPIIKRENFKNGKELIFSPLTVESVLRKIKEKGDFYLNRDEITQGIVAPQDFLNEDNARKLGFQYPIGSGIFVISEEEKRKLNLTQKELEILKPYYTTEELKKWYGDRKNKYWIIYAKSDMNKKINDYPNIKKHLDKFKNIITSDFGPYGLHRARNENFFKGEKIISLRKSKIPTFTYTDFDCFVSQTFFIIKTNRINMKYLIGILNSKIVAFWLFYRGKRQGNLYQVDKEPLMKIPIPSITPENIQVSKKIEEIVNKIISEIQFYDYLSNPQKQAKVKELEREIDQLVYKLYDLTEEEIRIIEEEN